MNRQVVLAYVVYDENDGALLDTIRSTPEEAAAAYEGRYAGMGHTVALLSARRTVRHVRLDVGDMAKVDIAGAWKAHQARGDNA